MPSCRRGSEKADNYATYRNLLRVRKEKDIIPLEGGPSKSAGHLGSDLIWRSEFERGGRTFRSDDSQDFTRGLYAPKLQGLKPSTGRRPIMSELKLRPPSQLPRAKFLKLRTLPESSADCLKGGLFRPVVMKSRRRCFKDFTTGSAGNAEASSNWQSQDAPAPGWSQIKKGRQSPQRPRPFRASRSRAASFNGQPWNVSL